MPDAGQIQEALLADIRSHLLILHMLVLAVLLVVRQRFACSLPRHAARIDRGDTAGERPGRAAAAAAPGAAQGDAQPAVAHAATDDPGAGAAADDPGPG